MDRHNLRRQAALAGFIAMALIIDVAARTLAQESPQSTPTPNLEAAEPLTVTLHPFPSYGTAPLTVGFMLGANLDPDDSIVSYQWNFGDGSVSTTPPQVLFHTYPKPGSYIVTVTIATREGRTGIGMGAVIASPPAR